MQERNVIVVIHRFPCSLMCGDCMPQFHLHVCETKISIYNWWELEEFKTTCKLFGNLPSSETQGRLVGARGNKSGKEMKCRMFTRKAKKPLGTDSYQTISKRLYQCCLLIGQKNPLYYSAQSANSNS